MADNYKKKLCLLKFLSLQVVVHFPGVSVGGYPSLCHQVCPLPSTHWTGWKLHDRLATSGTRTQPPELLALSAGNLHPGPVLEIHTS